MLRVLRSWKFWAIGFVVATLIGLAEAAQVYAGAQAMDRPMPFSRALSATVPSWYTLLLLLPPVLWLAHRFRLERGNFGRALAVHVPAGGVFALVHLALASWLADYVFYSDFSLAYLPNLQRLLGLYFVLDLSYYWALVGGYYVFDYREKYREGERAAAELALRASRLEGSLARANLETLRMQLNPHFLFNTLNAVSVLAMKGERQNVVRMLARLSDLLRLALENAEQVVPLAEELAFLEPYLEIEQVRFRDRLRVEHEVPPEALEAEVPSLLLQPLVENAIRHGIARCTGPGYIEIRAVVAERRLILEVRDSGPGFADADRPAQYAEDAGGHGVGIANTRARLEQLYGMDHTLELVNAPGGAGAIARVVIPFRTYRYEPGRSRDAEPDRTEARTA